MTTRLLEIEACAQCWYFEFVRGTPKNPIDRTYCTLPLERRIIPQTIDPSDEIPKWCQLPAAPRIK